MVKEPPITVVNKNPRSQKVRATSSRTRTTASSKHTTEDSAAVPMQRKRVTASTQRKKNKASHTKRKTGKPRSSNSSQGKKLPAWAYYVLMGCTAVLFLAGFYYLFIRPYAYRWKPCYGLKAYGVCVPSGYSVHGFDVSHHQGKIDWKELQKTQSSPFPVQFVFMKASEGGDFNDRAFKENFENARKYGFIRGAYHFYNPQTPPERQADFFIRTVNLQPGDLPPVLDIEQKGKDMDALRRDLKIWLKKIETHYQVKPILYTSYKFKTRYLNDSTFNSYPYWIAHYYVDSVRYEGEWKFWQHTDVGTLPGIKKQVDLNIFNGSMEELQQMTIAPLNKVSQAIKPASTEADTY